MSQKVYIVAAKRSAIGNFGGSLKDLSPIELGTLVAKSALSCLSSDQLSCVDEVIVGNVLGAGHGMNIARQIGINSALSEKTPAYTVNKVCGSGLKAVALGYASILLGESGITLVGGTESMSQAGMISLSSRWGSRLGHAEFRDLILQDGLTDVFHGCHMGITAENLAERYKISRAEQDAFALESQTRAAKAQANNVFQEEIIEIPIMKKGKLVDTFRVDEFPRATTSMEALASLKPAFKKEGTVTAGNASGINDGAAMLLLAGHEQVQKLGLKPMAEIVSHASSGVSPEIMGIGPVEATRKALSKASLKVSQLSCIEANEAFAAQALAVQREMEWDTERVNPNGGAIALGHPIGASGARILVSLVHQLKRTGQEYGLATLCVGGGQGIAMVVRNIS